MSATTRVLILNERDPRHPKAGGAEVHLTELAPRLAERGFEITQAGIYQFTPLKYHCLDKCRSPFSFISAHWSGGNESAQSLRLGLDHGLFCVGCCWTLMLLMFGVGAGNLGWMLLLGGVMAVEKNMPWGRRLSSPLGVFLVGCGGLVTILHFL